MGNKQTGPRYLNMPEIMDVYLSQCVLSDRQCECDIICQKIGWNNTSFLQMGRQNKRALYNYFNRLINRHCLIRVGRVQFFCELYRRRACLFIRQVRVLILLFLLQCKQCSETSRGRLRQAENYQMVLLKPLRLLQATEPRRASVNFSICSDFMY